jgi:hypothetical protein
MNKKEKNYIFVLFIFMFLTIIAMTSGIAYNYYTKSKNNNNVEVVVKNISLFISYNSGKKINIKTMDNSLDYNYNFNVSNYDKDYTVKYRLMFNIESAVESDDLFTYTLSSYSKDTNNNDKLITIDSTVVPSINTDLGVGTITPNQIHYYTLNIKYTGEKSNKLFVGYITLEKAID